MKSPNIPAARRKKTLKEKSFVLSAAFPGSKRGLKGLRRALDLLAPYRFSAIEYYCEEVSPGQAAALLAGKTSVFLAGARQKMAGLNPCALDRETREKAVAELGECFHFAREAGAAAVMLSSGSRPPGEADDALCLAYLADSLHRLHRVEPELPMLLEPGDRDVEYRQLLGPSRWSADFAAARRKEGLPLALIFDMSHAAQLGEHLETAWDTVKPCCDHIHLANCVLEKNSPIYGDKHPFFGIPQGVYSHQRARDFLARLVNDPRPLRVSLEMICPPGEREDDFFARLAADTGWFFSL
jgi:sugar phosphate isomerase/epimerase